MAKRMAIALLVPGFALAFLLPLLGVLALIIGGVLLAIALEDDLDAAEGGRRARLSRNRRREAVRTS